MSTIKETLKHSIGGEGKGDLDGGKKGRVQRFKMIILRDLRAQQGKKGEKMNKIRKPRRRNSSYILEIIQNIT